MGWRSDGARGRWVGAALGAALLWLALAAPALAHDGTIRWDGNPAHLAEDLLYAFGLPLVILLGGALLGVLLARVLGRGEGDEAEEEDEVPLGAGALDGDERPVGR